MTNIDEGALNRLADAVHKARDPRARAIDHFAEAVNGIFTEAAKRPGGNPELHMRLADAGPGAAGPHGGQVRARSGAVRPDAGPRHRPVGAGLVLTAR